MWFTDILRTWFILFYIYCAALKGRAAFCLTNDSIPFATYVVRMWITPCQRRNRVIFVPCAALTIGAQNGVCTRKFVHRLAIWTTIAETISVSVFCFVTSSDSPLIPFFPYIFIFSTKPLALSILTRLIFIFNLYQLSRRLHLLNFYYLVLFFLPLHSIPYKFLYTLDSIHLRNRLFIVL